MISKLQLPPVAAHFRLPSSTKNGPQSTKRFRKMFATAGRIQKERGGGGASPAGRLQFAGPTAQGVLDPASYAVFACFCIIFFDNITLP